MEIKKDLKIKLFAGGQLIAESSDANLWGRVLTAITGGSSQELEEEVVDIADASVVQGVGKFAKALGLSVEQVQGACGPSMEEPYLNLDKHYWESFQKNNNVRGRGAIGPLLVAGTLLALWFEYNRMGKPTASQALAVLDTIDLTDLNYNRTLNRCSWLQYRDKNILLNPAEMSKAIVIAKAYCTKQSLGKLKS